MKVLVILGYDDVACGDPHATAIVEMPEGATHSADDVFIAWWRKKHPDEPHVGDPAIIMEPYTWHVMEVEKI